MMRRILCVTFIVFAAVIPVLAQDFGWIGISIEDERDRGAIVRNIEPNSPAEKAGLKEGDVILEFNKQEVVGVQQLTRLVRETPVGRSVDVKVRRNNQEQTFKVTTERSPMFRSGRIELNLPDVHVLTDRVIRDLPRVQVNTVYVQGGIQVEQMTDQLRDFFGVFTNNGVLVTSVDRGSAAEKAGIKAGDVVTTIDGKTIRNPGDFGREMRAESKPLLKIIRDKKEREIRLE
jgi:serine protease Do